MTQGLERFVLGQPYTGSMSTADEVDEATREIFTQARHRLCIRAERLESDFFASEILVSSLTSLLTGDARNKILFLIDDTDHFLTHRRRILTLARTFSSYLKVHELPEEYRGSADFYIIADGIGYLHQNPGRARPARAESYAPGYAQKLERNFQYEWDRSHCLRELFTTGL